VNDTLSLATRLRAMADAELLGAMEARGIRPSGIKDLFDLADAFLDRTGVHRALTRLDRHTLLVVSAICRLTERHGSASVEEATRLLTNTTSTTPGPTPPGPAAVAARAEAASGLLLLGPVADSPRRYVAYRSVGEVLRDWPTAGGPSFDELVSTPPPAPSPPAPVPLSAPTEGAGEPLAGERAFAATTAVAELVRELERTPARELAKGGLSLPEAKRLATAMAVDQETASALLSIASHAGLAGRESGRWMATDRGATWLLESSVRRWLTLATSWRDRLPEDLHVLLSEAGRSWGRPLRAYARWLYPAGAEWMTGRLAHRVREAELLGIAVHDAPSTPGRLLLHGDDDDARAAMTALLPAAVDRVYLQHDLSVVAPGPLASQLDARLRALADAEGRTLASSYRISMKSINRALAHGESAESLLSFLAEISLTGIPQPLSFLIEEAAARHGLMRVGSLSTTADRTTHGETTADGARRARSYLRSDDAELLETALVDQSLASLGLTRAAPDRLLSRSERASLFWALSEARYPVAAENARREIVALQQRRTIPASRARGADGLRALIARVRTAAHGTARDTEQAWLARQLAVAIREKAAVAVSVSMPDGGIVEYVLEPTSVGHTRLRARDRKSDTERTLPLRSIVALAPVPATR
jgi:hypothetical protein